MITCIQSATHLLSYATTASSTTGATQAEIDAAIRMQNAFRAFRARRALRKEVETRSQALLTFSRPIYILTLFYVLVSIMVTNMSRRGVFGSSGIVFYALLPLTLCLPVLVRDFSSQPPIRFSLAHGVFFVAVLYRLSFVATQIDSEVWSVFERTLGSDHPWVSNLTLLCHFALFIPVTSLGTKTLTLVSAPNSCVHLMFFFQFFDMFFIYTYFNLRDIEVEVSASWVLMQILMQLVIFLRNSGTMDALISRGARNVSQLLLRNFKVKADPLRDPVYRLQLLARQAIQSDIAAITAVTLTPCAVSYFAWRDGFFTMEGTGILVRHCDLPKLWQRFAYLMLFKPTGSLLGRWVMVRKMRKMMLGKWTVHGRSQVVAKMFSDHRMGMMRRQKQKGEDGAPSDGAKRDGAKVTARDEAKQQEQFDLTEEERAAVGDELLISVLNYRLLARKQLKHTGFFTLVVLLQLFVALPVRKTALKGSISNTDASLSSVNTSSFFLPGIDESSMRADQRVMALREALVNGTAAQPQDYFQVTQQSVWSYGARHRASSTYCHRHSSAADSTTACDGVMPCLPAVSSVTSTVPLSASAFHPQAPRRHRPPAGATVAHLQPDGAG